MKKIILTAGILFLVTGCGTLRFAPSKVQKQNAWLHNRTLAITSQEAKAEGTSEKIQALTQLGESQSRAFVSYNGLPKEFPQAETAEDVLAQSNWQLARTASAESADADERTHAA